MKPFLWTAGALLTVTSLLPLGGWAQTADRRTSLSLQASTLQYQGNFGSDYWDFSRTQFAPGLGINQYLTRGLDLNTQVFFGELSGGNTPATRFTTTLINANLGVKLKLNNGWALKETARVQPYLLVGTGWTFTSQTRQTDTSRVEENKSFLDVLAGAGLALRLGGGASLFVQSAQHLPLRANLDGSTEARPPRWSDRFLQHTVGLTFNLGQAPDADEDGVPDTKDKCPNTAPDVEVNERGCPLDDDEDGVPNYQDQCPDYAGSAATRGCPDADQDGVDDTDDLCPDVAGTPELRGCPDADTDGVADTEDKCPDTPAGTEVDAHGCSSPTTALVTAAAPASATDTDGDGVPNPEDRCPDRAGPAANKGCPELNAASQQRLQEATKFIGFELNKAALLPSSFPTLDAIAQLLQEYPDYSLSIAGHTDGQGPAAYNQRLSRERAAAARQYVLGKGIEAGRVELRGYGARHPLAPNTTEASRTQNRRVEFNLFLTGDPSPAQLKYGPEPVTVAPKAASKPSSARKVAPARKRPVPKAPARKPAAAPKAGARPLPPAASPRPVTSPNRPKALSPKVRPAAPRKAGN